jgi:hypothetical protein
MELPLFNLPVGLGRRSESQDSNAVELGSIS